MVSGLEKWNKKNKIGIQIKFWALELIYADHVVRNRY